MLRSALAVVAIVLAMPAFAADVCAPLRDRPLPDHPGERIAAIACAENRLWFSPFIDVDGRLAHARVAEAESALLDDDVTPVWHRVVEYWTGSGLHDRMTRFQGGADCAQSSVGWYATASCRAFVVDTPWSAVFVSYVMSRAGIAGFVPSTRHVDYVRDAHREADDTDYRPYRLTDPATESLEQGDLLCFASLAESTLGHDAFRAWLEREQGTSLGMHCDIVIDTANGRAHLIGGNVLQGVTRRSLPLNRQGRLWGVQRDAGAEPVCRPGNEQACNFNRQNWVALLKLQAVLMTPAPANQPCCDACTLPIPVGMQRCTRATGATPDPAPDDAQRDNP